MNKDMFQKLLAGKRSELEYKLMRYYYNKDMDNNRKVTFMFAQYADTLSELAYTATGYCKENDSDILTPDQIDNITSILGGLFLEYNMKVQGKDLADTLSDALNDFISGFEEDTEDEE